MNLKHTPTQMSAAGHKLLHGRRWFLHVRRRWRNARLRSYGSLQHDSRERAQTAESSVMGYGQDFLSGQQLVSQLRGESDCFPHLDNMMTTAPFAYNMSVPELNRAVMKQTGMKSFTVMKQHPSSELHLRGRCLKGGSTNFTCLKKKRVGEFYCMYKKK